MSIQPYQCQSQQEFEDCFKQLSHFGKNGHEWIDIQFTEPTSSSNLTYKLTTKTSTHWLLHRVYWLLGWHEKSTKIVDLAFDFFSANQTYLNNKHDKTLSALGAIRCNDSAVQHKVNTFFLNLGKHKENKALEQERQKVADLQQQVKAEAANLKSKAIEEGVSEAEKENQRLQSVQLTLQNEIQTLEAKKESTIKESKDALSKLEAEKQQLEREFEEIKDAKAKYKDTLIFCSDGEEVACTMNVLAKLNYFATLANNKWLESQQPKKLKGYTSKYPQLKHTIDFKGEQENSIACPSTVILKLLVLLENSEKISQQREDEDDIADEIGSELVEAQKPTKAYIPQALKEMKSAEDLYTLYRLLEIFVSTPDYPLSSWTLQRIQETFSWKDYLAVLTKNDLPPDNPLIQLAIEQVIHHFSTASKHSDFLSINSLYLKEILRQDWIPVDNEEELVTLALNWSKNQNSSYPFEALLALDDHQECLADFLRFESIKNKSFKQGLPYKLLERSHTKFTLLGPRPARPVELQVEENGETATIRWRLKNPHLLLHSKLANTMWSNTFKAAGYELRLSWDDSISNYHFHQCPRLNRQLSIGFINCRGVENFTTQIFLNDQPLDFSTVKQYNFNNVDSESHTTKEKISMWLRRIMFCSVDQKIKKNPGFLEIRVELKFNL